MKRQLAAILYADVAGYSRLTGHNEEQTHRQLNDGLTLLANTIKAHAGRKVHEAGDAVLAEFESVTDAVTAAISFQIAMTEQNTDLNEDERVRFRIGVNLGEIIRDRGDIYGDGVNLAARVEEIAPIGGLCVSSAVFEQLTGTAHQFDDLGYRDFKNIERPVHVYQLRLPELQGQHPIEAIHAQVEHQPLFDESIVESVITSGRCACGSVRFDITKASLGSGYCHCRICQRSTGAPVFAWTAFPLDGVRFNEGELKYHRLSLIARQGFCVHCGTPVVWRSLKPEVANWIVLATTCLDNPADFAPTWHGCVESQLPWMQIHDDLPRTRSEEAPMLKKAWEAAGVADPKDWKELSIEEALLLDDDPDPA